MSGTPMPHRLAAEIADGRSSLEQVPAELRQLVAYHLGLVLGVRRARELNPRRGLAEQGGRIKDFAELDETTKKGVRLGLRREFFHRRHQVRRFGRA